MVSDVRNCSIFKKIRFLYICTFVSIFEEQFGDKIERCYIHCANPVTVPILFE